MAVNLEVWVCPKADAIVNKATKGAPYLHPVLPFPGMGTG